MPEESVVDALNIIHRALRPGGVLLDIHPRAVPSPFEVRLDDGTVTSLGKSEYNDGFTATIAAAERALVQQQTEGRFTDEQHTEFTVLHHFTTPQRWQTYRAEEAKFYVPATDEVIAAVHEAMAPSGAVLIMGEAVRATRYRAISQA
jgi:hypothetical protein